MTRTNIRRGLAAGGRRIGLLGGSFNPAHQGHLHISRYAIKALALDAVWWLVSPQNPLKSSADMAPLGDRMAAADAIVNDRRIIVTDVEQRLGTRYTADTIAALNDCFPDKQFVWIMGADNLVQFPRWKSWRTLFSSVPIAIFDRAPYSTTALAGQAANVFASSRYANRNAQRLADCTPPAWAFFHTPLHPASASDIRANQPRSDRSAT
ncbi:MAG: nicotinate-nucleotide adenylyltransferase [Rhodospirillaceae bacterium]|jgi:nicotinate-nucleotide adenylyltransferase|nr:nicotinate-nucleotide adenylyltransferase [Rhodospirillaceae bacterium]MBT5455189.1 nicotinate-nucleotide adenylyltransferase [Rhodospirillaceae bacterium]